MELGDINDHHTRTHRLVVVMLISHLSFVLVVWTASRSACDVLFGSCLGRFVLLVSFYVRPSPFLSLSSSPR